jgi:hypothetical protein
MANFIIPGVTWVRVNFIILRDPAKEIRRSLSTHCPILVRQHYINGLHECEEVCRCDLKTHKAEIHPSRCPSNKKCPVRVHFEGLHELEEPVLHY